MISTEFMTLREKNSVENFISELKDSKIHETKIPDNKHIRLKHVDGSSIFFKSAFAIFSKNKKMVAVVSNFSGYHLFMSNEIESLEDITRDTKDSYLDTSK